jgi:hypothetical protein
MLGAEPEVVRPTGVLQLMGRLVCRHLDRRVARSEPRRRALGVGGATDADALPWIEERAAGDANAEELPDPIRVRELGQLTGGDESGHSRVPDPTLELEHARQARCALPIGGGRQRELPRRAPDRPNAVVHHSAPNIRRRVGLVNELERLRVARAQEDGADDEGRARRRGLP